jgi:hypothetical protein
MFPPTTKPGGAHMTMGPLDTCKTPTQSESVPIPYANMVDGLAAAGDPAAIVTQKKIIDVTATKGYKTKSATAAAIKGHGDEAGTQKGIISNKTMSPLDYKMGSTTVKVEGKNVTHILTESAPGAGANAPAGMHLAPSQSKVLISG